MSNHSYHIPVLLNECVEQLVTNPSGVYVDLTFGGGGHSKAILEKLNKDGKLYAFDQDPDAKQNHLADKRFTLIQENFRYLKRFMNYYGHRQVNGVLGDLGVSSHQFDVAERGFSIRYNSNLDMRMNQNQPLTAAEVLNKYSEENLAALFRRYGELGNAKKIAGKIVLYRNEKKLRQTDDLKNALAGCYPKHEKNKWLAKIFQAIRIEVNQEIEALEECLTACAEILASGGRLVMISYHSLEDRLVKNLIRNGNVQGTEKSDPVFGTQKKIFRNLTAKPILPTDEEIKNNSRARSAKLRVGEKI